MEETGRRERRKPVLFHLNARAEVLPERSRESNARLESQKETLEPCSVTRVSKTV